MSAINTCNVLVSQAVSLFSGATGINYQLAALAFSPPLAPVTSILTLSAQIDAFEKSTAVRYPFATVCCERLKNTQIEKFRVLSGTALLVFEIKVSGSRAEDLETNLNSYVEAACAVLAAARGNWTSVGSYPGTYEVKFHAIRAGGKHFVKAARIEFEIHVSK